MNTENNKIIAKFLGWKQSSEISYHKKGKVAFLEHFNFHIRNDWNGLMEVVTKCYEYGELDNEFKEQIIASLSGIIDIEDTYNACVEFIKWYNKQNK